MPKVTTAELMGAEDSVRRARHWNDGYRPWKYTVEPKMCPDLYGYPVSGDKHCHQVTDVGKGSGGEG